MYLKDAQKTNGLLCINTYECKASLLLVCSGSPSTCQCPQNYYWENGQCGIKYFLKICYNFNTW